MNIIGIIFTCLLVGILSFCIGMLIYTVIDPYNELLFIGINGIVAILVTVFATLIGVGINTESEKIYVEKYLSQKTTIEQSLRSELLSGAERVSIVNKAIDINGELAEKKARYERWYWVCYEDDIYDNVEFIEFE